MTADSGTAAPPAASPAAVAASAAAQVAAARERGEQGFLSVPLAPDFDPRALLADPGAHAVVASYERPQAGFAMVAIGEAARAVVAPDEGPQALRAHAARLLGDARPTSTVAPTDGSMDALRPRLLAGFAFDGSRPATGPWAAFGCGALLLPRLLFVRDVVDGRVLSGVVVAPGVQATEVQAACAASPQPPSRSSNGHSHHHPAGAAGELTIVRDLDRDRLLASVASVAAQVDAGRWEKVVLAAERQLRRDGPDGEDGTLDVGRALDRLRDHYPHCHLFTFTAGDATFIGASPELLVGLRDGVASTLGLAGSAPRGDDEAADRRLGAALLASEKDRREHDIVVRALRDALAPLTEGLEAEVEPHLLRLRNIQHLASALSGRVRAGVDVLGLIDRLHPTPAVCGWPTAEARGVIREHEEFDRGWYAGPIGWLDQRGDGEFAIALRSALVQGGRARLFAGAGIMGDSRPEAELAEIELKFRPLASALGGLSA